MNFLLRLRLGILFLPWCIGQFIQFMEYADGAFAPHWPNLIKEMVFEFGGMFVIWFPCILVYRCWLNDILKFLDNQFPGIIPRILAEINLVRYLYRRYERYHWLIRIILGMVIYIILALLLFWSWSEFENNLLTKFLIFCGLLYFCFWLNMEFQLIPKDVPPDARPFYVYLSVIQIIAYIGFFLLIVVWDLYIPVPHFMDIGINEALYPFVEPGVLARNARMHDLFNYVQAQHFSSTTGLRLSNFSRGHFFITHGVTDHSPYIGSIHKISVNKAMGGLELNIKDMSGRWPTGLTKQQTAYYWIFAGDLVKAMSRNLLAEMIVYNVNLSDICASIDCMVHNPSIFENKDVTMAIFTEFTSVESYFRSLRHRPPITIEGYKCLYIVYVKVHCDILHIMADPLLINSFDFSTPEPQIDYLYPSIQPSPQIDYLYPSNK